MSFVLDLTRGTARVRQVVFNRGQPRPTVSIGRAAAWSIVAEDLEDVHAFVSFDGAALMVRSAEEHNPVWLDGRAVPCAWTPVGRAGILALGNARIAVTAKEDHARPGYDDDEPTGQIELRPKPPNHLRTTTDASGVTAVTTQPLVQPREDPDDGITGDEPTGEMTGARAPGRGLLPRPRVPPRAPRAPLDVPDFDDATQKRQPLAHPAPPPAPLDDEERTNALDLHAMQAAQAVQAAQRAAAVAPPPPRPARPNISIASDAEIDEATRMLAMAKAERAPGPQRLDVPLRKDHPLSAALAATVPAPLEPAPANAARGEEAPPRETKAPPSGATELRPMTAVPVFRAPPAGPPMQLPIDAFAATGGHSSLLGGAPVPAPGTADVTGAIQALAGPPHGTAPAAKKKTKGAWWMGPAAGLAILVVYYGFMAWRGRSAQEIQPVDLQVAHNSVPVIAGPLPDAGLVPMVAPIAATDAGVMFTTPVRNALPSPEFPHKGLVDAGTSAGDVGADGGLSTLQRSAVDALAEGDLGRSIFYYEQLATLEPNVSAYRAAARILRAQLAADAGAHPF